MQKQKTQREAVFWLIPFLLGLLIFLFPVVQEQISYRTDADEYAAMAQQLRPPETPNPAAPLPAPTEEPEPEEERPEEVLRTQELTQPSGLTDLPPEETEAPNQKADAATAAPSAEATDTAEAPTPFPADVQAEEPTEEPAPVQIPQITAMPAATKTPAPAGTPTVSAPAGIDLAACVAENPDFAAWITLTGTKINYPVVRSDRSAYYLHHLFSGKESKLGCLFSLTSSDYEKPSRNIAIYGHHLSQSDAMFSTLLNYKDSGWYADHPLIRLDTLYGTRTYRIFAVLNIHVSDWDASTASFASDKAFLRFVNRAKEKSFYETGVQVTAEDHILTLITCDRSYGGASGRLIVMAVQQE